MKAEYMLTPESKDRVRGEKGQILLPTHTLAERILYRNEETDGA